MKKIENMSVWDAISAIAGLMHEDGLTVVEIKAAADTLRRIKSDLYEVERFDAMSNRSKIAGDVAWILDKVALVVEDCYGESDMSEELKDDLRADIEWNIEELWTGCGIERIDSEHENFAPEVEYEMTSHEDDDDAMSDRPFNIDELLDFLGDYVEDYDVTGIIDDATDCDPITGNRFWRWGALDSEEFQRIVDKHEKSVLEDTLETITSEVGAAFRALRDQLDSDIADDTEDDDWRMSDRMSPTLAECEAENRENCGRRMIPLALSDDVREQYRPLHEAACQFRADYDEAMQKLHEEFTQDLPDLFFHLNPDDPADRGDYERILRDTYAGLFSHNDAEDDADRVEEWTEWFVFAGEQEELRFDSAGDSWRWCPQMEVGRAWTWVLTPFGEVPGAGPFLSRDDALEVFESFDPFLCWIENRKREITEDLPLELDRRFEVCLACQTVRRSEDGLESVRDDSVSLSKSFDITRDEKAKRLLRHVLGKS